MQVWDHRNGLTLYQVRTGGPSGDKTIKLTSRYEEREQSLTKGTGLQQQRGDHCAFVYGIVLAPPRSGISLLVAGPSIQSPVNRPVPCVGGLSSRQVHCTLKT